MSEASSWSTIAAITWSPTYVVGHGVHRDQGDRGEPLEDPLDRGGGEVLAVDAHPVGGAAGEVDPAVGVAVGEVAGPVHAVPHPLLVGGLVVVVALEVAGALRC